MGIVHDALFVLSLYSGLDQFCDLVLNCFVVKS